MRLPLLLALPLALLPGIAASQGRGAFTVAESGQSFGTLDAALNSLNGGNGTIRIAPGRYRDCTVQTAGRVAYVAAEPGTVTFDGGICEGKAVLVLRGQAADVRGIIFTHLHVSDGNGAGIRIESGDLKVSDSMFTDSQGGILSANDEGGTITIDHSTFSGLGKDPTGNGAHSVYIGDYGNLIVTNSRFERGSGGHYLKSRAAKITVLDNSFDDSQGHNTNYLIDLSNGASGRIAGNSFVQGPDKENYTTMITIAPEGVDNDSSGLVIEKNRAWLAPGFKWPTAFVGDWAHQHSTVRDNTLAKGIQTVAWR